MASYTGIRQDANIPQEEMELELLNGDGDQQKDVRQKTWYQEYSEYISPAITIILLITFISLINLIQDAVMGFPSHGGRLSDDAGCGVLPTPPVAKKVPYTRVVNGDEFQDDYYWMTSEEDVMKYVKAENEYAETILRPHEERQKSIASDIKKRNDFGISRTLPFSTFWIMPKYFYYVNDSLEYPVYVRFKRDPSNMDGSVSIELEQLLAGKKQLEAILDLNKIFKALELSYLAVGVFELSPSEDFLAFSIDVTGNERFLMYFKDLKRGVIVDDVLIPNTYYGARWANDEWIYFNAVDLISGLPRFAFRYRLETSSSAGAEVPKLNGDVIKGELIHEEQGDVLVVDIDRTNDDMFILIKSYGQITTEVRAIEATAESPSLPQVVLPKQEGVYYDVDHREDAFVIRSNKFNPEFDIFHIKQHSFPLTLVPESKVIIDPKYTIERVEVFQRYILAWAWNVGLRYILVIPCSPDPVVNITVLSFGSSSAVYSVLPSVITDMSERLQRKFTSNKFLYSNTSFLQPFSTFEYDVVTGQTTMISRPVVKFINTTDYVEKRILVPSYDNQRIPMTLLYKKTSSGSTAGFSRLKPSPVLLSAYGAYGGYIEPSFVVSRFSLLERGVILAFAHPRGDGDLGSKWYKEGKYELKMNTFLDVRSCLQYLKNQGIATELGVMGRSAGGLIVGTSAIWFGKRDITNDNGLEVKRTVVGQYNAEMKGVIDEALDPNDHENRLVSVVIGDVAYVDVITDMINATVPWTAYEWTEWGDPKNLTIYNAMKDYSPYDNIQRKSYPAIYLTAGLKDSRVKFYEPLRFVARLRAMKTNEAQGIICENKEKSAAHGTPLLIRTTNYGHFGGSGGAEYEETASWMTFALVNFNL